MEMVKETNSNVSTLRQEIADGAIAQKLAIEDVLADAFPEGDPVGHRKHHEAVIKAAEKRAQFWTDMATSVAKWGIVGLLAWLVTLAWQGLLSGPPR